jgi:hypothetical protein
MATRGCVFALLLLRLLLQLLAGLKLCQVN